MHAPPVIPEQAEPSFSSVGRPPRTRRRSVWLLVALLGALLMIAIPSFFLVAFLGARLDYSSAAKRLPADVQRAIAAGVPMTAKELQQVPAVPDDENAAPILEAANKQFGATVLAENGLWRKVEQSLAADDYDSARQQLNGASAEITMSKKAAAMPACDFHHDWDLGASLNLEEESFTKQMVRLLAYRAEVEAHAGDHDAAISDLRAARNLDSLISKGGTIISLLVGISGDQLLLASAERCMASAKSPADLRKYVYFLQERRPDFDNMAVLRTEAYSGIATLRNYSPADFMRTTSADNGRGVPAPATIKRQGMPDGIMSRAYMARYLETYTKVFNAVKGIQNDPRRFFKAADSAEPGLDKVRGLSYLAVQILMPIYSQIGSAEVRDEANWNMRLALAKVLEYRAVHGVLPKDLAAAGANEIDPIDGKPLRYRIGGRDVRVYSVGRDGKDDGGIRRQELPAAQRAEGPYDEVASYPPPSRSRPQQTSQAKPGLRQPAGTFK